MSTVEQLLMDSGIQRTDEIISAALGDSFTAWQVFREKLPDYDISLEWRYYKDGGWLAKGTYEKKTAFWGSVSEGFFTISLHFTEKPHIRTGILELDISGGIKRILANETPKGRLFTVKLDIYNESQIPDIFKLIGNYSGIKSTFVQNGEFSWDFTGFNNSRQCSERPVS